MHTTRQKICTTRSVCIWLTVGQREGYSGDERESFHFAFSSLSVRLLYSRFVRLHVLVFMGSWLTVFLSFITITFPNLFSGQVTAPPQITRFLSHDLVKPDEVKFRKISAFRLPCEASGSNLQWRWQHNGTNVIFGGQYKLGADGSLTGEFLEAENTGNYQCFVKDTLSDKETFSRKLKVAVTCENEYFNIPFNSGYEIITYCQNTITLEWPLPGCIYSNCIRYLTVNFRINRSPCLSFTELFSSLKKLEVKREPPKKQLCASVHPKKFKNTQSGIYLRKTPTGIVLKYFMSAGKINAGLFKLLGFLERFRNALFLWQISVHSWSNRTNKKKKTTTTLLI